MFLLDLFLAVVMLISTRDAEEKHLQKVWSFFHKDYLYLMQAKTDQIKKPS